MDDRCVSPAPQPPAVAAEMRASAASLVASAWRVADETPARADLSRRSEIKFVLPAGDVLKLRRLLETNCRRVVHNAHVSAVRSIYLDDEQLSACRANLDGLGVRRKLRLRWYDSLLPHHQLYFEIKWRVGRVTGKQRCRIDATEDLATVPYRRLLPQLAAALPEPYGAELWLASQPVIVVEYQREHFVAPEQQLRITMDYQLAFYDQLGKSQVSCHFPRHLPDVVIVEAKGPVGSEWQLRNLFYPFALHASKFSKYVHGCRLLGLVSAAHRG